MQKNFSIDLKTVGGRIRDARKERKMTQEGIAKQTTLTGQYVSLIENGRCRGSVDTYIQISTALGITLNDLFYDDVANIRIRPSLDYAELLAELSEYEKELLLRLVLSAKTVLLQVRGML